MAKMQLAACPGGLKDTTNMFPQQLAGFWAFLSGVNQQSTRTAQRLDTMDCEDTDMPVAPTGVVNVENETHHK